MQNPLESQSRKTNLLPDFWKAKVQKKMEAIPFVSKRRSFKDIGKSGKNSRPSPSKHTALSQRPRCWTRWYQVSWNAPLEGLEDVLWRWSAPPLDYNVVFRGGTKRKGCFYVGYDIRRWAPDPVFNRVISPINGLDEWASLGLVIAPMSGVMGPYLILLITGFWGTFYQNPNNALLLMEEIRPTS